MKLFGALVLVLLTTSACAGQFKAKGLEIYMRPDLNRYASFSHVCRMSDGKQYYAVLGAEYGTVFINYTDNKLDEADFQFFPGAKSHWRECRSYNHPNGNTYAYVVTEGDAGTKGAEPFGDFQGGIQIFKLKDSSVELVNTYVGNFNSAHTITIDKERGLAFVNGSNWRTKDHAHGNDHSTHLGGMRILDIETDPENPRDIGFYNKSYTHDSFALGEVNIPERFIFEDGNYKKIPASKANIVYLADIFEGYVRILDTSDAHNPKLIDSLFTPLGNQYPATHNVWASEDKKWLFVTEETSGSSLLVYDITNPAKPRFVSGYRSKLVANDSIAHNVMIKGEIAYVTWYKDGLRLIDVSNPVHPEEIAYFDSSTKSFKSENNLRDQFHGNWSVDVDERGLIMISDIEEGLFILRRTR
jgi:choice-of-anchor B domain-containing protein